MLFSLGALLQIPGLLFIGCWAVERGQSVTFVCRRHLSLLLFPRTLLPIVFRISIRKHLPSFSLPLNNHLSRLLLELPLFFCLKVYFHSFLYIFFCLFSTDVFRVLPYGATINTLGKSIFKLSTLFKSRKAHSGDQCVGRNFIF